MADIKIKQITRVIKVYVSGRRGVQGPQGPPGDVLVDSVNGKTGIVQLTTDDIPEATNKYVSAAEKTKLANLSGVNTGDQDLTIYVPKNRLINGYYLDADITLTQDDILSGTNNKQYSSEEQVKLGGIQEGATANDTDANLKNRANHTGTQSISTVTNLQSSLDAKEPTITILPTSKGGTGTNTLSGNMLLTSNSDGTAVTTNKAIPNGAVVGTTDTQTLTNKTLASPTINTPTGINKADVGLANVDNTSDTNKPISTLAQTALNAKLDDSQKGAPNGLAELDSTGTVPTSQLPSYVDDIIEVADFASLPATGEASKIYVTLDTDLTYRWGGSSYVQISSSLALGETATTAYRGDRGKIAYDHSQLTSGNPHNVTKTDVGLSNVDNTSDVSKPVSTATQTALNTKQPLDSDLTTIAGLTATTDNMIQSVSGAWASRTPTQVKTALSLNNVDNTSDTSKPISSAQQTAITAAGNKGVVTGVYYVSAVGNDANDGFTWGSSFATIGHAFDVLQTASMNTAGTVYVGQGTFTLSATVTITRLQGLVGMGANRTIIENAYDGVGILYVGVSPEAASYSSTNYPTAGIKGFTIRPSGTPGANTSGIQVRDIIGAKLEDIFARGFTGTNGIGIWSLNYQASATGVMGGFVERLKLYNVSVENNTFGIVIDRTVRVAGNYSNIVPNSDNSQMYHDWISVNVNAQAVPSGSNAQTGVLFRNGVQFYHGYMNIQFNITGAAGANTVAPTAIALTTSGSIMNSFVNIRGEGGTATSLYMDNSGFILATGVLDFLYNANFTANIGSASFRFAGLVNGSGLTNTVLTDDIPQLTIIDHVTAKPSLRFSTNTLNSTSPAFDVVRTHNRKLTIQSYDGTTTIPYMSFLQDAVIPIAYFGQGIRIQAVSIFSGSGAPNIPNAIAGSIYFRTDTPGTQAQRIYIATGTNVWVDALGLDSELAAIAGLTSAADKGIQFTGPGTAATYDLTTAGKALLDDADAAAQRVTLNLGNVDNTSDLNKPVSTAQQAAIDAKQSTDATLTNLAAFDTNGLLTQTATDTFTGRTIAGTTNQVTVTNGDGVSGNPTLSLPQNIHTAATPTFAGETLNGATGNTLVVDTSTLVVDATNNRVGVGTATPLQTLHVESPNVINFFAQNTGGLGVAGGTGLVAGTSLLPTAADQRLGFLLFHGQANNSAGIVGYTKEAWSATARGSYLTIETIGTGSTTRLERIRVNETVLKLAAGLALDLANNNNLILSTSTGTKIGTATTQKLAFYNSTPIVQPTGNIVTALGNLGLVASPTIASTDMSDFSTAADARIAAAAGTTIASLSSGKIPTSQLPSISLVSIQTAASQAAQLALTTQEGDVVVRTDVGQTYMRNSGTTGTMTDFTLMATPTSSVTSVNTQTGAVTLSASDLGLENVDNTSDADKPVSTDQQAALDLKAPLVSPSLTGTPTAPTATPGTNTTQIATTAFTSSLVTANLTPDATTSIKGKVQLANDLGGTSALPEVKSRIVTATIGKTTGDFPVSSYTAITGKSAFDLALEAALTVSDKVLIRNSSTVYTMRQSISAASNKVIEGESESGVKLQLENARNVSMVINGSSTVQISNFVMRNITLDHNGVNQTAGGGIVVAGLKDSTFENMTLPVSFRFSLLIQGMSPTANQTGTVTFTNGSEVVNGVGTLFTTELVIGSIIKEPTTSEFARVAAIVSNTQIRLTRPWSFATQTAVTYKLIPANSKNTFRNVKIYGTLDARDNMGFGLCDYSLVENCYSANASGAGCGFVPDHARGMKFINCLAVNNANAGFSYETAEDIFTYGCHSFGAQTGNGFQLISGGVNCDFTDCHAYNNFSHGFAINNNSATYPIPTRNRFSGITAYDNGGYGMRIDGSNGNYIKGDFFNNNTGGYIQNTANSIVPTNNTLDGVRAYDDRTVKQQQRGIYLVTGVNTMINFPQSADADHTIAGITDTATGTTIITSKNGNIGVNNNNPANRFNVNTPTTAATGRDALYTSSSASSVPFAIQSAPSQTGNLMELMSSAGNNFMLITSGGLIRTTTSAVSTPAFSFASEGGTGMGRLTGVANTLFLSTAANMRVQIDTNRTQFTHGMQFARTAVGNVNYTILATDYLIEYTSLTATRTVTLPTAVGVTGQQYKIKDGAGTAGTNNIVVAGAGGQTVDGAASKSITANYGSMTVYSNGTNWLTA